MEIEKIEKFIDAGYTKEEINALLSGGNPEGGKAEGGNPEGIQKKNEDGNGSAKHEEPKEQGAENSSHDQSLEITATLQALTTTVKGLQDTVKAIQAASAKTAATDKPKTDEIKSIMDSFINSL